jgi:lipopolysaccharide transport system ATP-binding protein
MPAIEVSHLTKEYRLGALQDLKQTVLKVGARLAGRKVLERPLFKALDDVSFTIEPGEVVGIIGHNGAGKSTLLKMLARISTPTHGSVKVSGRIAPLIEVGAGFVPDFTGRENVYLNGSILGMSKKEIDRKFDEIVDFAEMAEFIDTPVKRYSSGMQVKLAFAVATAVEAEILIIDEVLAVGDVAFQRKCLARMETTIKDQGRTVIIVGHNIRQLERICTRMILLRRGQVELDGSPGEASKQFLDETTLAGANRVQAEPGSLSPSVDTLEVEVVSLRVRSERTRAGTPVCGLFEDLCVDLVVRTPRPMKAVEIVLGIHNPEMVYVAKTSTQLVSRTIDLLPGTTNVAITIERLPLSPGVYGVGLTLFDWSRRHLWGGNGLVWLLVDASVELAHRLPASTMTYLPSRWVESNTDIPGA